MVPRPRAHTNSSHANGSASGNTISSETASANRVRTTVKVRMPTGRSRTRYTRERHVRAWRHGRKRADNT
jgi:hypothetical protein